MEKTQTYNAPSLLSITRKVVIATSPPEVCNQVFDMIPCKKLVKIRKPKTELNELLIVTKDLKNAIDNNNATKITKNVFIPNNKVIENAIEHIFYIDRFDDISKLQYGTRYQYFISMEIKRQREIHPFLKNVEYMKLAAQKWVDYKMYYVMSKEDLDKERKKYEEIVSCKDVSKFHNNKKILIWSAN
ncbi:putative orfan [Tupanvirus soda lake]|uniref:Orfan n=2 Tax=Tupanvirus TaxID=2094720 RepID=A0AC62ACL0_9VIRU|nr:putative orfan [Tupanvirus soda lake]QKU35418.1 putative orfan [Tupanvirus soda lake]